MGTLEVPVTNWSSRDRISSPKERTRRQNHWIAASSGVYFLYSVWSRQSFTLIDPMPPKSNSSSPSSKVLMLSAGITLEKRSINYM